MLRVKVMNNFLKPGSLAHRSTKYDRRWTFILIIMFFAAGCAKLQHLDQLLTLKGLSDEQTRMGQEIERQDAEFERLVAAVEEGSIAKYKSRKSVSGEFGPPVYIEKDEEDGRPLEVWVYRYAARFFDSPKVYLYWDQAGNLIRWDYQGGQDGKIEPETTPQKI